MADAAEINFDSASWDASLKKIRNKWKDIESRKTFGGIIAVSVYQDIIKHFDMEEGPKGAWQAWSHAYEKHLKTIGRSGNKILQFSGRLRQSISPTAHRATSEGILFYDNAKTKSGFPYAQAHDEGGSTKGRPPQRKFMWLSSRGMSNVVKSVESWLSSDEG